MILNFKEKLNNKFISRATCLSFPLVGNLFYRRHSDLFGIVLEERFWTSQNDTKRKGLRLSSTSEDSLCRNDRNGCKVIVLPMASLVLSVKICVLN